ncbi:MAG: TIR domain-containing protein [Candidatus Rokuibacteriota bacterium]
MTAAAVFDVFLSHSRQDDAAVELLARRLEDAGLRPWFDRWHLVPGTPWQESVEEALEASRTCAIVIGPSGVGPWENEELRSALSTRVAQPEFRVIPVLLPGATMPEHGTVPKFLARLTWVDFRGPQGLDDAEAFRRLVAGVRGVGPGPSPRLDTPGGTGRRRGAGGPQTPPTSLPELRNRRDLLTRVKGEIADRLAQSLHHMVLMNLSKERHPQEVKRPWDVEIKLGARQNLQVRPDTEIIDVFDEEIIAGKLLILGAPGAGKTTTLLQLARDLVDRAEINAGEPMPVLLNLSSWKNDGHPLASWLVPELYVKYGIRRDIGRRWLDERRVLPLLDGLDELEPALQEPCVRAINQLQQDNQPQHLVVCCRLAEYQNYETKLHLNGAVHLLPLTEEQIRQYLRTVGCSELWETLRTTPELLDLAKSPLLLSMMIATYMEGAVTGQQRLGSSQDGRRYLFDTYIERMLSRGPEVHPYGKAETLHWLAWLARRLHERSQSEFLLERLQPSWLESLAGRVMYRAGVLMSVALSFAVLLHALTLSIPGGRLTVLADEIMLNRLRDVLGGQAVTAVHYWPVILAVTVGLIAGVIVGMRHAITPIETVRWSLARAWTGMGVRWLNVGLNYGAYFGLIVGLAMSAWWLLSVSLGDEVGSWGRSGKIAGGLSGAIAVVATLRRARSALWRTDLLRGWRLILSADAIVSGLIFGVAAGFGFGLTAGVAEGLFMGGLSGLSIGIFAGLTRDSTDRPRFGVSDGLVVGAVGWVTYGWITWQIGTFLGRLSAWRSFSDWMLVWGFGWIGLGAAVGLVVRSMARVRDTAGPLVPQQHASSQWRHWLALRWRRWLTMVAVTVLVSSSVVGVLIGSASVSAIALFFGFLGLGLTTFLGMSLVGAMGGAWLGAFVVAMSGALLGALSSGLTGPDIERRAVPNQGIRRSAVNAAVFAVVGGLVLGSIWGLFNLGTAVLMTGVAPEPLDWVHVGLANMLFWALVSALVPGAACIQHFILRLVLWCRGVAPWRYAHFLDYATERMFLQRIGGSYRFIHDLLRDHFAAML